MKSTAMAMTRSKSAPMVAPTIIAIFLLLFRLVVVLEAWVEVGDGVGAGGWVLALGMDVVGAVSGVEAVDVRGV